MSAFSKAYSISSGLIEIHLSRISMSDSILKRLLFLLRV